MSTAARHFGCNGFDKDVGSPGGYNMVSCALIESASDVLFPDHHPGCDGSAQGTAHAGLAIGLGLALISHDRHPVPPPNLSVNPARSTGPAVMVGIINENFAVVPMMQLWLFWAAPIAGAVVAGIVYPIMGGYPKKD